MKKILVNHFSSEPNKITGITIYTWAILKALVNSGRYNYVLATNWDKNQIPADIRALNIDIVLRRQFKNESLAAIANTVVLPRIAKKHDCKLIFHPQPTSMLAGMDRSVVVIHDLYRVTHPHLYTFKQKLQWCAVTARGFRKAGQLVAVSNSTKQAILGSYSETSGRVHVVHEASPISATIETELDLDQHKPFVLAVANVTPNKNIEILIEALQILAQQGICPDLVFIGRDPKDILRPLKSNRGINVKHMEAVDENTLKNYYKSAYVYVNTSIVEGFCLPILEAQTFGACVICSDLPVLREVAGEGALFIDPKRPDELVQALNYVFDRKTNINEIRSKSLSNARRFSWAHAARETEKVFDLI